MPNHPEAFWNPEGPRYAVFDGDLLVYKVTAQHNDAPSPEGAFNAIDRELLFHREFLGLDDFTVYVKHPGEDRSFRKAIHPGYKAHRANAVRPIYLDDCYRHLLNTWGAQSKSAYEADDLMGIACTQDPDTLLCSFDKDLNQIPGWHYDWRTCTQTYIDERTTKRFLAQQMLEGDRADNIKGVPGIGKVKAAKILQGVHDRDLLRVVLGTYRLHDLSANEFAMNYKCLKILTIEKLSWPDLRELGFDE